MPQPPAAVAELVKSAKMDWQFEFAETVWVVGQVSVGAVPCCQVKVRVQVVVKPQPVIVNVNIWVRLQPLIVIEPAEQVAPVTLPHSLVAVMAPPKGVV